MTAAGTKLQKEKEQNGRAMQNSFADKHLNTIVIAILVVAGWIANFAIMQARLGSLEEVSHDMVHRSEYIDALRRVDVLEKELVPRSEHLIRDEQLNKRLDIIQDQLKIVQEDVGQIKTEVRRSK